MNESQNKKIEHNLDLVARPPVVVVMGHIDHGKTTLLDYIRKTEVALGESGGITQHIGAYQAIHNGKQITFIDTPGHEAFSKMRSRGAKVADIAVLVIAADDGIKPQTKESLIAILESKIPFVVAINKIDKESADSERVKNELSVEGVFLEGRGGNVPFAEISAKTGSGITELLETILLMAEVEDLKANPKKFAEGVIIESHHDAKRGSTATVLVRDGILKKGEYMAAGNSIAKIKILEDFAGNSIDMALPSSPVLVIGFSVIPQVGSEFKVFFSQKEAVEFSNSLSSDKKVAVRFGTSNAGEAKKPEIGIIIKSDTEGSAEAILGELIKLRRDFFELKVLRTGAGDVSEDDVRLASSSKNPLIVAFKVKIKQEANELSERFGIKISKFDIIYEVNDSVKREVENILPPEIKRSIIGKAKILKIFGEVGKGQIVGGKITEGFLQKNSTFSIIRRLNKIGEGKIESLQIGKINTDKVEKGHEFGAKITSSISIVSGDELEIFFEESVKIKL